MGGRDEIVGAELKIGSWFEKLKLNFTTSVSYTWKFIHHASQ